MGLPKRGRLARISRANAALIEGNQKPRAFTRGRDGIWIPGMELPPLRDFVGTQPSEEVIGIRIINECRLRARTTMPEFGRLFHVPNGGKRGKAEAARLKAQGVRPGVPDYCLPVPRGAYHGLMFELKKHDGRLEPEQRLELDLLAADGYLAACCWGVDAAMRLMLAYLAGKVNVVAFIDDPCNKESPD